MISEVFNEFINALEQDNVSNLESILDENIVVDSSALGIITGKQKVMAGFTWKGMEIDYHKIRIFNNVIREHNGIVYQTCFSVHTLAKEENNFMNIFQCVFLNAIQYVNNKMVSIKSNMTCEHGNSLLVSNWWKLIDYSVYEGSGRHIIDGNNDSPWLNAPINNDKLTDEEQIKEIFYRYEFDIDTDNFDDLLSIGIKTCNFEGMEPNSHTWANYLKDKRHRITVFKSKKIPREVCWNHISSFKSLKVNGDRAHAEIYRYEPNRIGTRFLHKYNMHTICYSHIWNADFIKIDGKWFLEKYTYPEELYFEYEDLNDERYF